MDYDERPGAGNLWRIDRAGGVEEVHGSLVVAVLEVVVAWRLHVLLRDRVLPVSVAALVSRSGYAVLLAASALALALPGGQGAAGFRADWSLAVVVLGVHLTITALATAAAFARSGATYSCSARSSALSSTCAMPCVCTPVQRKASSNRGASVGPTWSASRRR